MGQFENFPERMRYSPSLKLSKNQIKLEWKARCVFKNYVKKALKKMLDTEGSYLETLGRALYGFQNFRKIIS